MHFSSLELLNFRNYEKLNITFGEGINCITGNNGEGKTNILEAIHFLALTRGFQARNEKYALKRGEPFFMCKGLIQGTKKVSVQCNYIVQKGKKVLVNKEQLKKLSDHIGSIPLLLFLPNDTDLIHGSASLRRKFIDSFIAQYDKQYLQALIRYDQALTHRNALLSAFSEQNVFIPEQLLPWNSHLLNTGRVLFQKRTHFLEEFQPYFEDYFNRIVLDQEVPEIVHESLIHENTAQEWEAGFEKSLERDRYSQRTSFGVHKDDLVFGIDDKKVKNYGSQGQQKTFVISLKFAQAEILRTKKKAMPILLLDDIFDKLDMSRLEAIAKILDEIPEGQVFITDTSPERIQKAFGTTRKRPASFFELTQQVLTKRNEKRK